MRSCQFVLMGLLLCGAFGCAHQKVATVLPKGGNKFEVIGQSSTEQNAYARAEQEANYTCEEQQRQMVVHDSQSIYQGVDKDKKGDVEAENVALAFVTGSSGKERNADDYKVTLHVECM